MGADAAKPSAMLPQGSTAIDGKKVYVPVAMSSRRRCPGRQRQDARLLVFSFTQWAVT